MVHEHVFTCYTTLITVNFLPKSTKCVSNVVSLLTVSYRRNTFFFLLHNQMFTLHAGRKNFLFLQKLFHCFAMELPYLSLPVKYY